MSNVLRSSSAGELLAIFEDWSAGGDSTSLCKLSFIEGLSKVHAIFLTTIEDTFPPTDPTFHLEFISYQLSVRSAFLLSDFKRMSMSTLVEFCRHMSLKLGLAMSYTTSRRFYPGDYDWQILCLIALRKATGSHFSFEQLERVATARRYLQCYTTLLTV